MRAQVTHRSAAAIGLAASLVGTSVLAGCSSPTTSDSAPAVKPSASAAAVVRLALPAELYGLPQSKDEKWLKVPKSMEVALKGDVLPPEGGSVAAAYLDPADVLETIELSVAAGRVVDPASVLRRNLGTQTVELEDVRPVDLGTGGAVGSCGVSHELRPAVETICNWAAPGSVGWVRITSLKKDRRDRFAELHSQLVR